jgi:23S rRNA (uracil1939-C5)-methyltransferase
MQQCHTQQEITPKCTHFGVCGGCTSQNIPYDQQLKNKEARVQSLLAPFLTEGVEVHPIVGCAIPWQYRNKMEFSFSSDKAGNRYLGLYIRESRGRVLNLTECHLVNSWFAESLKYVREWWSNSELASFHPYRNTGSLRTLTLRESMRTGDRMAILTVSGNPDYALNKDQIEQFVQAIRKIEPPHPNQRLSIFLRIQQAIKGSPTQFFEIHLYGSDHLREELHVDGQILHFRLSPSAFFQPNTLQAEILYSKGLSLLKIGPESVLYDLYCGTATLGISVAHRAKKVVGIELSPESIVDARENLKLNNINNMELFQGDVGKVLADMSMKNESLPDAVMVDPPRAGLDPKAIQYILALNAPQLLYISCNPATQAANLEILLREGYCLKVVQPIDQFPQTPHIENIVILTR